MSALTRARISSFLAGVAVAGAFGVFQLRHDLEESRAVLSQQVKEYAAQLEGRVAALEASSSRK
ncbi:hypothetical protein ACKKBG_A00280 [Auxenochlorella protothecoides x Auxenochlorella symbiontica]